VAWKPPGRGPRPAKAPPARTGCGTPVGRCSFEFRLQRRRPGARLVHPPWHGCKTPGYRSSSGESLSEAGAGRGGAQPLEERHAAGARWQSDLEGYFEVPRVEQRPISNDVASKSRKKSLSSFRTTRGRARSASEKSGWRRRRPRSGSVIGLGHGARGCDLRPMPEHRTRGAGELQPPSRGRGSPVDSEWRAACGRTTSIADRCTFQ